MLRDRPCKLSVVVAMAVLGQCIPSYSLGWHHHGDGVLLQMTWISVSGFSVTSINGVLDVAEFEKLKDLLCERSGFGTLCWYSVYSCYWGTLFWYSIQNCNLLCWYSVHSCDLGTLCRYSVHSCDLGTLCRYSVHSCNLGTLFWYSVDSCDFGTLCWCGVHSCDLGTLCWYLSLIHI